jgi:two-component system, cell cycle sensor histidine kinase and response regulator CckA
MRILNVDDREENRYLVEALLKGNGYEVVSVANGAEALSQLRSTSFDLIISDILMPVMDGFQLCRAVKAEEGMRCIPFIVYTATYTGPQDEAFAIKIGADRFILKPCEPDTFIEEVRDVLEAAQTGGNVSQPVPPAPEEEVLKLYNERLVRKLEQKMLQLEKEVRARQNTEEILRQSEKKYRSLYNSIRDAILVADTDRRIIDCNQAFVDLFGYTLSEIAGKETCVLYENREEFEHLGAAVQDKTHDSKILHTIHYKKKDGAIFPGEVNVFFLRNDEGAKAGLIGLIRDITERVRAEKTQKDLELQLHQAQKMESVGRLAGGVAHDFNNMLSVILGYSELALQKLVPGDKLYGDLREIHKAAVRSTDITRQLLAFARKQIIAPIALDLNEAVEGILKMLRRLIGEDIDLAWLPGIGPLPVMMDPSQVDQLLANLCVNARDAINGVGRITIETDTISFDTDYYADHPGFFPGDYVLLAVSDDGCGMDRDTIGNIFEPFFTTKEIGQGTGLGLATVYGIVKQNNGFINVYSEPGKGTTFKIYLARHADPALVTPRESPAGISAGRGESILVVEDEASILKLAARMLEELGYTVMTADSPNQALRLAEEGPIKIDLLITDVVMPGMNGKELSSQLQEICPGLKTLFMSGYTANVIAHRGVLDEGIHFIQKPFSTESMAIKVRAALKR